MTHIKMHYNHNYSNLIIVEIYHYLFVISFELHLIEIWPKKLCRSSTCLISFNIYRNLIARVLKNIFTASIFFQLTRFSVHWITNEFLGFIKATVDVILKSITCEPLIFEVGQIWLIGLLELDIALSKILYKSLAGLIIL